MSLRFHDEATKRLLAIEDPIIRRACEFFYEKIYFEDPPPSCDFDLDYFVRLVLRGLTQSDELVELLEGRSPLSDPFDDLNRVDKS